jgi:hypothetical protein
MMYGTYGLNGEGGFRAESADCKMHICACAIDYGQGARDV